MTTIKFTCCVNTTDNSAPLGVEILLDDQLIYNRDVISGPEEVSYDFPDEEGQHVLQFKLKNKTGEHTKIDESGSIVSDACLTITDVAFDAIDLGQVLFDHAVYEHDFNGTGAVTKEGFFGTMGCNGTVTFKFTTPIYLWLLENM